MLRILYLIEFKTFLSYFLNINLTVPLKNDIGQQFMAVKFKKKHEIITSI